MKIFIDSSRIQAHELKIFLDNRQVFNSYMPSNPKGDVELDVKEGNVLRFEYRYLQGKELDTLEAILGFPEKGIYSAYNEEHWVAGDKCPSPGETLYATTLNDIPEGIDSIELSFRSSAINEDMPILVVTSVELRDIIQVTYERNKDYTKIMCKEIFRVLPFVLLELIVAIIVLTYFISLKGLEHYHIQKACLAIEFFIAILLITQLKGWCIFFYKVIKIKEFRQENNQVIRIK